MPKSVKGNVEPRKSRYPWEQFFDGKQWVFYKGKDFKDRDSFGSTIHQAARRAGIKVATATDENGNVRMQALSKPKKAGKTARKSAKPAAKKAPKPRKRAAKKPAKTELKVVEAA